MLGLILIHHSERGPSWTIEGGLIYSEYTRFHDNIPGVGVEGVGETWGTVAPIVDTLEARQNGRHFADDIFSFNYFYENYCILVQISVKFLFPQAQLTILFNSLRPGDVYASVN